MKSSFIQLQSKLVAPFTGAWIEIKELLNEISPEYVAPFTGAWIEISIHAIAIHNLTSLPSRERGLVDYC